MTILYSEILWLGHPSPAQIFFAADRLITRGTKYHSRQVKIQHVPGIRGLAGFFGLAEFANPIEVIRTSDWLRTFLHHQKSSDSPGALALELSKQLNATVPLALRHEQICGFHLAGFEKNSPVPEFWHVRNIDDNHKLVGRFVAREDFQRRDASKKGFDGKDPRSLPATSFYYRNGDIGPHVAAWKTLDDSLGALLRSPGFKLPNRPDRYAAWIKYKMSVVAQFHHHFAKAKFVGGGIDVLHV